MTDRIYLCIDLKSFYASVECVKRGLDPLTANLVVADPDREKGTICLAVSPSMRAMGVKNRCRVFQIPPHINYIMAPPQMKLYIEYSADIYAIYLKYIAKEDIYVYSIDEAFMDVTDYLPMYRMTARELGMRIMQDIRRQMGIPAACGIGTNLYLAKIALDITAKHASDYIGYLDEKAYRETLWEHRPITDFWRIGPGIAQRLSSMGITSMGEVAHMKEDLLYKAFGVDAEYLIDHAWGRESVTIPQIKAYKAKENSLSNGQVLFRDYDFDEGLLIVKEMVDLLCLDLVDKGLVTDSVTLYIGYSGNAGLPESETGRSVRETVRPARENGRSARGSDHSAHGTVRLPVVTDSVRTITKYTVELYERIVSRDALIRRVNIGLNNVREEAYEQYDLFTDPVELEKDRKIQQAVLDIKKKYGKNAIIKGMNLQKGATTLERNRQIGGHKSGESGKS